MVKFTEETCKDCGCTWGLPFGYIKQRRIDGKTFYCPNGHQWVFNGGETAADVMRRERDRLKQQLAQKDDEIRTAWNTATELKEKAERERRRANGYKGHATRITTRAKAGVCPCCDRTFRELAEHMATKHPEFTPMSMEGTES